MLVCCRLIKQHGQGGALHVHQGGASGGYAMQIDIDQRAPVPPPALVAPQYQPQQYHQPQPVALHGQVVNFVQVSTDSPARVAVCRWRAVVCNSRHAANMASRAARMAVCSCMPRAGVLIYAMELTRGPLRSQWRDNLFDCCGVDGPSSFLMAICFPCCTPCLMAKISSRIR